MRALPRIAQRVLGVPLAIAPAKLEAVLAVLGPRIGLGAGLGGGPHVTPAVAWDDGDDDAQVRKAPPFALADGVAVVAVHGITVQRGGWLDAVSGLVGYDEILSRVSAAYVDPAVRAIVLDVDSPGGEVAGVEALAGYIAAVAEEKPMVALANEGAYSAGYWLAASARRVMVPRTGGVGSIGVVATHVDRSGEDQERGHAYTFIHAGARKIDGHPHGPLADSARAAIQAEVDRLAGLFHAHVATMRGLAPAAVAAQEAATFHGEAALAAGLADRIGTLADAIAWARALAAAPTPTTLRSGSLRAGSEGGHMTTATKPENTHSAAEPLANAAADAAAEAAANARVREIAELCKLAGCPEAAVDFITEGRSIAAVRAALLERRAAAAETQDIVSAKAIKDRPLRPGAARLPDPFAIYKRRAAEAAGRKEA